MWNRITERDGYVRYEINRDNPVLQLLFETIDDKEFDLFNTFISQTTKLKIYISIMPYTSFLSRLSTFFHTLIISSFDMLFIISS